MILESLIFLRLNSEIMYIAVADTKIYLSLKIIRSFKNDKYELSNIFHTNLIHLLLGNVSAHQMFLIPF